MYRILVFALLALISTHESSAQTATSVEQELMKLEQTWNDVASIKKDRAVLEQILADDYVYTHSNGAVTNKAHRRSLTLCRARTNGHRRRPTT